MQSRAFVTLAELQNPKESATWLDSIRRFQHGEFLLAETTHACNEGSKGKEKEGKHLLLQNTFELFEAAQEICCCVAQALSISSRS
jgi:hypothetical protein